MRKLVEKPYLIFFILIPAILLFGILSGDSTLSFMVKDTYFVLANSQIAILFSELFGIIGIGIGVNTPTAVIALISLWL